ncbi:CZB domain-containing protein [Novosphingobium cyanobacteriorum]|uniref:CZB domain-containing protein n=1 Tax=Novosphingobium cyanobacteriorum TaxID=3024215 RepID=A0ABT6CRH1_9SPHN|nr:CZB domain-containing protein [Novosphingobium cyanobacteriorum]MDF8335162.1 CZB domain-containing protein [Novosphingobium cyanobacteriorum]
MSQLRPGPTEGVEGASTAVRFAGQIQAAIHAHLAWKVRLRAAVLSGTSTMTPEMAKRDDICAMGTWLYSPSFDERAKQGHYFEDVIRAHALFHQAAGEVLHHARNGEKATAGQLMHEAFIPRSDRLVCLLEEWSDFVGPT